MEDAYLDVIKAIISASAQVAPSVFERWVKGDKKSHTDQVRECVSKVYDKLRPHMTITCLKVLIELEYGQKSNHILCQRVHNKLQEELDKVSFRTEFAREFQYRLKLMCALGLLTEIGGTEYALSKLGHCFLEQAKGDPPYIVWFDRIRGG
jgi:hypothetical protein